MQFNIHKPAVFLQENLLNLASRTPNNDELQALWENTSPVLRKNCYLPGFFPRGFLGGKKFEVVNTHTDTQTRLHSLTGWVVKIFPETSNFVFPKLPTWGFSKIVFSMHLFFSRRRRGRCLLWSNFAGLEIRRPENSIGRSGIDFKAGNVLPGRKSSGRKICFEIQVGWKNIRNAGKNDEIWMKYDIW